MFRLLFSSLSAVLFAIVVGAVCLLIAYLNAPAFFGITFILAGTVATIKIISLASGLVVGLINFFGAERFVRVQK